MFILKAEYFHLPLLFPMPIEWKSVGQRYYKSKLSYYRDLNLAAALGNSAKRKSQHSGRRVVSCSFLGYESISEIFFISQT